MGEININMQVIIDKRIELMAVIQTINNYWNSDPNFTLKCLDN